MLENFFLVSPYTEDKGRLEVFGWGGKFQFLGNWGKEETFEGSRPSERCCSLFFVVVFFRSPFRTIQDAKVPQFRVS